jgi:hypothetical protein
MSKIEFETYVKDSTIKIPEQYRKINNKKIKVIIVDEEENLSHREKVEQLITFADEHSIMIGDALPDREERNER